MAKVAKDGVSYEVHGVQVDAFLKAGWTVVEESATAAEEPVAEAEAPVEEKPKPKRRTTKKA